MADYSFDVVSKVDMNVIAEAVSAAGKEISNRYDFKGTNSNIELNEKENELKLTSADEYKVAALRDVLFTRLAKRGVALKNLTQGKVEAALGGNAKQSIKIQQGIPSEKAKEISRYIKDCNSKWPPPFRGISCACRPNPKTNCRLRRPNCAKKILGWTCNLPITDRSIHEKNPFSLTGRRLLCSGLCRTGRSAELLPAPGFNARGTAAAPTALLLPLWRVKRNSGPPSTRKTTN